MKIFEKRRFANGMREVRLFGFRIFAYFSKGGRVNAKGVNNIIKGCPRRATVVLYGDNNTIEIGPTERRFRARLMLGTSDHPVKNCRIIFGKDCSCEKGSDFIIAEDDSEIIVGDDAQISYDVEIRATDCHAILDAEGKTTNRGRFVRIGKHCWIAARSTILKNVVIPDGSVIGASAVVTPSSVRDAGGEAVILAGNPARIVKRGVCWDRRRADEFEEALPASVSR